MNDHQDGSELADVGECEGEVTGMDAEEEERRREELARREEYRRQLLKSLLQPHDIVTLIASIVLLYFMLAWLFISPMIKAFWPW
ncbi:MAG: hypothetical protein ACK4UY_12065 [Dietzia sp.]